MKRSLFSRGILLSLGLALLMVQPASAVAGVWTPTSSMIKRRNLATAILLPDGKVLVVGGNNSSGYHARAELYTPATQKWTATGSMAYARYNYTATLLLDGRVLVAGGTEAYGPNLGLAELYDPATGLWTIAAEMGTPRAGHTATLLENGKVLVAGGYSDDGPLFSAELYDPAYNSWIPTGSINLVRWDHSAVRLLSGEVLVMGGVSESSAELYDPATGSWTPTGSMNVRRVDHTVTLLPNGTVLVAGGTDTIVTEYSNAELYDPATGAWTETGSLGTRRRDHTATLLPNGKVLVAGGANHTEGLLASAELYDPATGTWTGTGSMGIARTEHTAVLLQNSKVLVAGGWNENALASAEVYTSTQVPRLQSGGAQDGWVLETSEDSNQGGAINATTATFSLGDNASNRQYRSILHFNTSSIPDNAVIIRVVLRIRRYSLSGTDPFTTHGDIAIDIRRGPFGNAGALQPTDFQAVASKADVGAVTNNPQSDGWYLARLRSAAHPFINLTGITQFRLRFQMDDDNDAVADFLRFYSGNATAASRPVLVVEYYVP